MNAQQNMSAYDRLIYKNIMQKQASLDASYAPAPEACEQKVPAYRPSFDLVVPQDKTASVRVLSKLAAGNHSFIMKMAACCAKKARCKSTCKRKMGC